MVNFLREYNDLKGLKGIEAIATYELFKQPLIERAKGDKKIKNLEDTDQESVLRKYNGGYPLQGNMYTFFYKLDELDKKNDVNDKAPILHLYGVNENGVMYGLNLNLLPNLVRLKYLEAFYKIYKEHFTKADNLIENNKVCLNKSFITTIKIDRVRDFLFKINNMTKEDVTYAYRTYKFKNVAHFRLIEYSDWKYIPFFNAKNSFLNNNLNEIYRLYLKTKIKQ
ncbi:MAG: hypothetical protein ACRDD8_10995 [Bacteroidales bacterium]